MNRQFKILLILFSIILFGNCAVHGQSVTLFAPQGSTTTYLMNENEEIINTWESSYRPGLACYLLDDKSLCCERGSLGPQGNSVFGATGGAGGVVEHYDWDGAAKFGVSNTAATTTCSITMSNICPTATSA